MIQKKDRNGYKGMKKRIKKKGGAQRIRFIACVLMLAAVWLTAMPVIGYAGREDKQVQRETFRYEGLMLCPGGSAFGVKFSTRGILVVGFSSFPSDGKTVSPAAQAGMKINDVLLSVDGRDVNSISDFLTLLNESGGRDVSVTVERNQKTLKILLTPLRDDVDGTYKAGLWLRDSTAGIGTVTYVDPETGAFGGLGHGICNVETGALMPLLRGSVMSVEIGGVIKGEAGKPGEIKGFLRPERLGIVSDNTMCGVFGVLTDWSADQSRVVRVASRQEVTEGCAELLCTLGDDGVQSYSVELSCINRAGSDNKNYIVTVTDETLIARTGGIIQGMSGSPILQNGKLIGAVTHVLVHDPKRGYGIFIENMLDAANG